MMNVLYLSLIRIDFFNEPVLSLKVLSLVNQLCVSKQRHYLRGSHISSLLTLVNYFYPAKVRRLSCPEQLVQDTVLNFSYALSATGESSLLCNKSMLLVFFCCGSRISVGSVSFCARKQLDCFSAY